MKAGPTEQQIASPSQRFTARIIDTLVVVLLSLPLFLSDSVTFEVVGAVLSCGYFFLADSLFGGQSLGKRLCGIRVVAASTLGPCSLGQDVLRMAFLIPPVFIREGLILLSGGVQRIGDNVARTYVLRVIPLPDPEERPLRPMRLENLQDLLPQRPKADENE